MEGGRSGENTGERGEAGISREREGNYPTQIHLRLRLTHRLLFCRRVVPTLNGGGHPSAARLDVFEGDGRAKVVLAARPNYKDRGYLFSKIL